MQILNDTTRCTLQLAYAVSRGLPSSDTQDFHTLAHEALNGLSGSIALWCLGNHA